MLKLFTCIKINLYSFSRQGEACKDKTYVIKLCSAAVLIIAELNNFREINVFAFVSQRYLVPQKSLTMRTGAVLVSAESNSTQC